MLLSHSSENSITTRSHWVRLSGKAHNILERSGTKEAKYETDTDMLISSRLVEFGSIRLSYNKERESLEGYTWTWKEARGKDQEHNEQLEGAAIEEAKEAITLEGEIDSLHIKLNAVTKERDYSGTIERNNPSGSSSEVRCSSMKFVMIFANVISEREEFTRSSRIQRPKESMNSTLD